jgi:hypothetical protein
LTRSTNPIVGIRGAIINTGSYAGVAYSDEATWFGSGNNILTGGVHDTFTTDPIASLTAAVLAAEVGSDAGDSQAFPNAIFMTYANWQTMHNALQAQGRGSLEASKYSTGAKDLMFMGIPIFRSRFQTANQYFVLNSNFLDFRTPAPKILNTSKKEELSPWSTILLMVFYGILRVTLPRAQVRVTVS